MVIEQDSAIKKLSSEYNELKKQISEDKEALPEGEKPPHITDGAEYDPDDKFNKTDALLQFILILFLFLSCHSISFADTSGKTENGKE